MKKIFTIKAGGLDIKVKDIAACLFFIFIWIIPIAYKGITTKNVQYVHPQIRYLYSISYLFVHSTRSWPTYYIQALSEGSEEWSTLNESDFFKLRPFGWRTRFSEYYRGHYKWWKNKKSEDKFRGRRLKHMAWWIAEKYQKTYPEKAPLQALRFVRINNYVKKTPPFEAKWTKRPLEDFPRENWIVVVAYYINKIDGSMLTIEGSL